MVKSKMRKALYAFSGDPITYGHIDIIKRAASMFDNVIVGIGTNPEKQYLFSLEERLDMAKRSLASIENAEVLSFKGLLVDFAYENGIPAVIKGVRDEKDLDYEMLLHKIGESQKLGIDTFLLPAKPELSHISSGAVKAIQKEQGLVCEYVPLYVKQCLEAKLSGQYIVGITGEVGVGKTHVSKTFEKLGMEKGISVHNIELDKIGHQIIESLTEPKYHEIREEIASAFGAGVRLADGRINRKALGEIVFNDKKKLEKLNEIMYTPLVMRLRREAYGKKGLLLLDAALIAESGMTYLCNNNTVLVTADKQSQKRRLTGIRSLTLEQIERRLASQYSFEEKKAKLNEAIEKERQGNVWIIDNSDNAGDKGIKGTFDSMIKELKVK